MDLLLFSGLFLAFGFTYWLLGLYASRSVKTDGDYFLAGRSLGFFSLTATLVATQLGGGMILGTAAHAYYIGIPGMFYSLGMSGGFLVLGLGIAAKLRSFNIATIAELFESQFGSIGLKRVASFLSILALAGIFMGQVVASKSLITGLGFYNDYIFILFWALLIGYTMYGGLPAVIITDIMQVVVIVGVFVGLFIWMWWQGEVALSLFSKVFTTHNPSGDMQGYWVGYMIIPILFALVEQDLAQRFFAARSQAIAAVSALIASVLLLLFTIIPVYFGMYARVSGIALLDGQNPLITLLAQKTPPFIFALALCALIAAIASTADSLLCAISSNVVQDFIPSSRGQSRLFLSRIATFCIGVAGIIGAYYFSDILYVLTQSYELLVSSIFISVAVCFTSIRRVPHAATISVLSGSGSFLLFHIISLPFGLSRALVSLGISALGYGVGYAIYNRI